MGRGKHSNNKIKGFIKLVKLFFVVLLIISVAYIVNYYWNSKKEQDETDELLNTVVINEVADEGVNEETERMMQVKELKKEYPEVMGWIEIEDTNINYPVMQSTTDNNYYLSHNYKNEESKRGSIYLDKDYDWSIPSSNLLMYGHNNTKDGSMFADLLNYKKESFYKEHPTIKFTTDKEDAEYDIIAVFLSRVYYKSEKNVFRYYYFVNAENEEEYNDYVNNAKKDSLYDTGKTAKYGDQLITLSTCEYSQEDGRFVVVGRKNN